MYIWLFSRSDGEGSAITRKTRGLTRSVIALIVPPLPAPSRPSKTITTRRSFALTHSCSAHNFACRRSSSSSYFFRFMAATRRIAQRGDANVPLGVDLGELLNGDQRVGDLAVAVERRLLILRDRLVVARAGGVEISTQPSAGEDRLQQRWRGLPDRAAAAQQRRKAAADSSEEGGEADRW